ncbi:hypothetical protein ElyMa_000670700 [Elysia marginata]|uniref:Uncharacterized protein n=1 Tax=Elysia marginata TaxID=1093978 RepID=A0AAV4GJ03_9GAST|nr:hypothetical protein ElyMa_000670700 [Elysia marginata]
MRSLVVLLKCAMVLAALGISPGQASCSFPSGLTSTTWRSTRWDDLTFTSSQLTVPEMDDLGSNVIFNCDASSGTKYLLRSDSTVTILTNNVEIVACLDFSEGISAVKIVYYHATSKTNATYNSLNQLNFHTIKVTMIVIIIIIVITTTFTTTTVVNLIKIINITVSTITIPTMILKIPTEPAISPSSPPTV